MNSSRVIYYGIIRDKWRGKSFTIYRKIIYCRIASKSNTRSCGELGAFDATRRERISFDWIVDKFIANKILYDRNYVIPE